MLPGVCFAIDAENTGFSANKNTGSTPSLQGTLPVFWYVW